jgi:hypothetical protein
MFIYEMFFVNQKPDAAKDSMAGDKMVTVQKIITL